MPGDMPYDHETSPLRLTCRLEAGDWLYIPSGWWHIAHTQAESIHLSIGVLPVVRLKLFEFLTQRLARFPFWCQRLAWVQADETDDLVPRDPDKQLWEDMRAQLNSLLAQEQTFDDFMAYLVDTKRTPRGESPADYA
jgi:ribosomal protein L16 Arg81 hydroxylase